MSGKSSLFSGTVVLLAHGPSAATFRAGRTLAAAVPEADVVVVAGTEPGVGGANRLRGRAIRVADGFGPLAVADAIESCSSEPVLVIHDDVAIGAGTIDRLVDAHMSQGMVVVPSPEPDEPDQTVSRASMACVVGSVVQVARLAEQGSFGPGLEVEGEFLAVQDASIDHANQCASRFASVPTDSDRPLLVAAMIVRDESLHLASCLETLEPLVDRVEIVDTGSLDDTVQIALDARASVSEIAWRDDFAWARNQVLERCRDARYVLWIDADERLRCPNPARFRQLLHTLAEHYPAYRVRLRDLDSAGVPTADMWQMRVFCPDDVHFVGAIHERVERVDGADFLEVSTEACTIEHLGYQEQAVSERDKFERNLRLAREAFDADPGARTRAHYYRSLGRGSMGVGDPAESLAEMDALISDFDGYDPPTRAMLLTLRANVCLALDDPEAAAASARDAVDSVPSDVAAGAVLAEALVRLGRTEEALATTAELASRSSPRPLIEQNLAAEQGRAWALFRACLAEDDLPAALNLTSGLAPDKDPWPDLVNRTDLDVVEAASLAAATEDTRFVTAFAAADRPRGDLEAALGAFTDAGAGSTAGPLRRAIARQEKHEAAPALRAQFTTSGSLDDLHSYAAALLDGFGDLLADLAAIDPDAAEPERAGEILGLCADAHARRDANDAAVGDAIDGLELWPGAIRAGVVVASAAAASGWAEVALEVVAAVREARSTLDTPARDRHALANAAVLAQLAVGDLDAALGEAANVLQEDGDLSTWDALIDATAPDLEKFAPVLSLALASDGTAFIDATRQTLGGETAAVTCLSYLAAGGTNPAAVTTGIVTATVTGRADLAEMFLEHRMLIDPGELSGLATVLRGRGHEGLADRLAPAGA